MALYHESLGVVQEGLLLNSRQQVCNLHALHSCSA